MMILSDESLTHFFVKKIRAMRKKILWLMVSLMWAFNSPVMAGTGASGQEEEDPMQVFVGKQVIDLQMRDLEGQTHRLSEYVGKGKWVLIDFWASWCGPCRAEMPDLVKVYKKFHANGFEVVGISLDDDAEDWQKAVKKMKLTWHHLSDLAGWDSKAVKTYKVFGIPSNLLVNPKGKIVASNIELEELTEKLAEGLGE